MISVVEMFLSFYAVIHWGTGLYIMAKNLAKLSDNSATLSTHQRRPPIINAELFSQNPATYEFMA